jgi:hypothetical protein
MTDDLVKRLRDLAVVSNDGVLPPRPAMDCWIKWDTEMTECEVRK